jgi:hypothetical protein
MSERQRWTEPVEWVIPGDSIAGEREKWRELMKEIAEPFVCLPVYSPTTRMQFPGCESVVLPAAAVESLIHRVDSLERRIAELEDWSNTLAGEL